MLIDSNIIIYAAAPENGELRRFIADRAPAVSAVSYVEVLGYHRLNDAERAFFEEFFAEATILHVNWAVLQMAVRLRQQRRITLGDALIAATCLVYQRTLVTRNVADFVWVQGLRLMNPFEQRQSG
jgi:toxin FitB